MASYNWTTGVLTPSPERTPIDPNDPEQNFTSALARLKASQPTLITGERVVGPPTAWQRAGEMQPDDDWDSLERRLDSVPRTPMSCPCCEPL